MGDFSLSLRTSIHKALGGGPVVDVVLYRKWYEGTMMLVSSTTTWYLFEIAGYSFLSFVANVLLLLVVILFIWAKSASLLNRLCMLEDEYDEYATSNASGAAFC